MTTRPSIALALLLMCAPVLADLYSANDALSRGDSKAAVQEFQRLAEQGDAKAQTQLGYLYYTGEGIAQSYTEAVKWYQKAATQGERDAQYNLAVAFAFGEGVPQDYAQAATWYRRAADQGHVEAQYSLGLSYSYGEGIAQDPLEATKWFRKAADQGYVRAQVQLGSKYHTGDGVPQDYKEAARWYRLAADRGDPVAQYNLGSLYRSGMGVEKDYNQALRWFRMAADHGYAAAQSELASLERTVAAASRPRPAPGVSTSPAVTQTAPATPAAAATTAAQSQPAAASTNQSAQREPLFSVDKSDLLTLKGKQASENSGAPATSSQTAAAEPAAAPSAPAESAPAPGTQEPVAQTESPTPSPEAATEKKSGGVLGFLGRMFHPGARKPEPATEPAAATPSGPETAHIAEPQPQPEAVASPEPAPQEEPSKSELLAMESVEPALPDTAKPPADALLADHPAASTEATTTTPSFEPEPRAEPKRGFFSRLFGRKPKAAAPAETQTAEAGSGAVAHPADISDAAQEPTPLETPETAQATPTVPAAVTDSMAVDLGAAGTATNEGTTAPVKSSAKESGQQEAAVTREQVATVSTDASAEVTESKSKHGFFRRLFGRKEHAAAPPAEPAPAADQSVAMAAPEPNAVEAPLADQNAESFRANPAELKAAIQAVQTGKYADAFPVLRALAAQGDPVAQFQVGALYHQGLGVERDLSAAAQWYRRSAEQGNADAQYSLGNMYLMGEGLEQDYGKARQWYQMAAASGHEGAKHNLSNLERIVGDTAAAPTEAEGVVEQAAPDTATGSAASTPTESSDSGNKPGFFKRLFRRSEVPEQPAEPAKGSAADKSKDAAQETTAAPQEPAPEVAAAQPEAAPAKSEETGADGNERKGRIGKFFGHLFGHGDEQAAQQEPAAPASEAAGAGTAETTGPAGAEGSAEGSTEGPAQSAESIYQKGIAYSLGEGLNQDQAEAFKWFLAAARMGHAGAQYKVGAAYAFGEGTERDPGKAQAWYEKAAAQGFAMAQRNLGSMYMNGEGVQQNKPLALAWYNILAAGGNVMDIRRRDMLMQELSESEVAEAQHLAENLKAGITAAH